MAAVLLLPALVAGSLMFPLEGSCGGGEPNVDGYPSGDYLHRAASVTGPTPAAGLYYATADRNVTLPGGDVMVAVKTLERFDGSWRIHWTGCSFAFQKAFVVVDATCADDNVAAAGFFGKPDPEDMCEHAAAIGYCPVSYFAAACPASCKKAETDSECHGDTDFAAAKLAEALGFPPVKGCAGLADLCGNPGVAAVCKKTCEHPEYIKPGHIGTHVSKDEFQEHYDRRLDDELKGYFDRPILGVSRNEAAGRRVSGLIPAPDSATWQRRLSDIIDDGHDIIFKDQFQLTSEESLSASLMEFFGDIAGVVPKFADYVYECPGYAAGIPDGPITQTCDPSSMFKLADGNPYFSCDRLPGFTTYSYTFCPWLSIDVPSDPELAAKSCFSNPNAAGFEDDTADSNAICAPREVCEDLCLARDDCIGVDLVIGKPRCFLNRVDPEHKSCSENEAYVGTTNTLSPPDGWYHPDGPGLTPGARFPDGHVPARKRRLSGAGAGPVRRLAHEKLWVSEAHKFLRKESGMEIIYKTSSDAYCQGNNINIADLAGTPEGTSLQSEFQIQDHLCSAVCPGPNPGPDCEEISLSADDTEDFALCGYTREECESICTKLEDCAGFDMHKTLERCWLNTYAKTCPDLRTGLDHDLVTKVYAEACQVEISGTEDVDGIYFQAAPPGKLSSGMDAGARLFTLPGTTLAIEYNDALPYFWAVVKGSEPLYAIGLPGADKPEPYDVLDTRPDGFTWTGWWSWAGEAVGWQTPALFAATCPDLGLTVGFHCIQDEMCQTFGYCMLSEERLNLELATFRMGEDLVLPLCEIADNASNITEMIGAYTPKVVADTDRLEYVIDMTAFRHTADGHYLNQELYRDGSDFRIRVRDLKSTYCVDIGGFKDPYGYSCADWNGDWDANGKIDCAPGEDHAMWGYTLEEFDYIRANCQISCAVCEEEVTFDMGVISMFGNAGELSADYLEPEHFTKWVTDIMRFELFDADGYAVPEGTVTIDIYLPMHSEMTPVILFVKTLKGWKMLTEPLVPQTSHPEKGWYVVTLPFAAHGVCNVLEVAGAMDLDDCPNPDCEENARCVNQFGKPSTCECLPGWKSAPEGHCVATEWTQPKEVMLHIENDSPFTTGWRIQEIKLYSDAECKTEMIDHSAYGAGPNGWSWRKFEDSYLPGNNYVPSTVSSSLLCKSCATSSNGCSSEGRFGPTVDADSNAVCVSRSTCLELCAAAPDCMSIDMHEYLPRCFMNKQNEKLWDPSSNMEDVHYEYWEKQPVVSVTASSSFEWHPAGLVNDGSYNSEWWSAAFRKDQFEEYLDFKLTHIGAPKAVKVFETRAVDKFRVSLAMSGRERSLDVPTPSHVQHAESGEQVEDRTKFTVTAVVEKGKGEKDDHEERARQRKLREQARKLGAHHDHGDDDDEAGATCVPLTCGEPLFFATGEKYQLAMYEDVPSACHCKQMCLDHVDEGCRSWLYYDEIDTNYWTDKAHHGHTHCTLYTVPPSAHKPKKESKWAMSGGVDLILFGFEPATAPVGTFSLRVNAAGLPAQSSKQRIKVVEESCSEEPVAEAVGLSCSSPFVCHPQPAAVVEEEASWEIEMLPTNDTAKYKVCYCAGVCYSAGQWTMVPGTLTVPGAAITFAHPDDLTAHSGSFDLDMTGPLDSIAIVPAFGDFDCNAEDYALPGFAAAAGGFTIAGGPTPTAFSVAITATYGSYKVCGIKGGDIFDVPSTEDGPYLVLESTDADAVRTAGIFRNAATLSTTVGKEAALKIPGADLEWSAFQASTIAIGAKGATCGTGAYLDEGLFDVSAIQADSSLTELGFSLDIAADVPPGKYPICLCTTGTGPDANVTFSMTTLNRTVMKEPYTVEVTGLCSFDQLAGELVVTRRVHVGKDYVLDPMDAGSGQVSIEITGSDLDYTKDRIMVINCQDTCGRAEASEYVFPKEESFPESLAVNDKAYGGELPVSDPYTVDGMYTEYEDRFCRLNNLKSGSPELLTQNLCYPKCSDGCVGDACFCDGYYQGFDTEDSAALCLPRVECEHLCTLLGAACFGIDMHVENNRCFLNGPGCAAQLAAGASKVPGVAEGLGYDTSYSFLVKSELPGRQLQEVQVNWASSARGELVLRPGVSTTYNLRFSDLTFTSAGRYKVCFCDSEHGPCASEKDFSVEIGFAHVSGVHCLLTVPKLRATKCYQQYYGGLSCSEELPVAPLSAPAYPSSYGTFPSP